MTKPKSILNQKLRFLAKKVKIDSRLGYCVTFKFLPVSFCNTIPEPSSMAGDAGINGTPDYI